MDSVTQAALGAAVAHGCWHRSLGRRAIVWGAVLGTLPDLDILAYPWMDAVDRLIWHRGISHAPWFLSVLAVALAALVWRFHRHLPPPRVELSFGLAYLGVWLILVTHVLIDLFTVYGTQLMAPFSRHGFALNNLFIIDPLYTLPLLLGLLFAILLRTPRARFLATVCGLTLSTLYVGWSFVAQSRAAGVFVHELARQGYTVAPGRAMTSATPFNTLLWRHLAEVEGGFVIGYWSWLDGDNTVRFDFVPRPPEVVASVRGSRAFAAVAWFSREFWAVVGTHNGQARVVDLRFGELRPHPVAVPAEWGTPFAWSFPLAPAPDAEIPLLQVPSNFSSVDLALSQLWRRLQGDRTAW